MSRWLNIHLIFNAIHVKIGLGHGQESTFIKVLIKKTPSHYLDRELHTRCVGSPVMIVDYHLC